MCVCVRPPHGRIAAKCLNGSSWFWYVNVAAENSCIVSNGSLDPPTERETYPIEVKIPAHVHD